MLIGELSARTGFSRDTIRFYEKQGLITLHRRQRRGNNYKEYSEELLERLLAVKRIKSFGFTLNEVADLLDMMEIKEATCKNVSGLIDSKVGLLDKKINELILLRNQLLSGVQKCKNCCDPVSPEENCPILTTDMITGN